MTLCKKDLACRIASANGHTIKESHYLIDRLLEIIKSALEAGEGIMISGFGKFHVRDKGGRGGRHPVTGNALTLDARRVVTFTCSNVLKKKLNQDMARD